MDKLFLGNSIELIKSFSDESVHAIISDIPYGIGYDDWDVLHNNTNTAYGGASSAQLAVGGLFKRRGKPLNGWSDADKKIPQEYQDWCSLWASDWLRVLKPGGSCFIFAGRRYAHRCIIALEEAGFTFKDMLSWEYMTAGAMRSTQKNGRAGGLPICARSSNPFSGFRNHTKPAALLQITSWTMRSAHGTRLHYRHITSNQNIKRQFPT